MNQDHKLWAVPILTTWLFVRPPVIFK